MHTNYDNGWRRPIGCFKLQVIFRKRATNCKALLRKITYKDKASYVFSPPCTLRAQNFTGVDEVRESCHMYEYVMFHMWHDSFICVAWLIPVFGIPHTYMWHDPFKHVLWLTAAEGVRECVWVWVSVTFAKSQFYISRAWQDKHQCYIWYLWHQFYIWHVWHQCNFWHVWHQFYIWHVRQASHCYIWLAWRVLSCMWYAWQACG